MLLFVVFSMGGRSAALCRPCWDPLWGTSDSSWVLLGDPSRETGTLWGGLRMHGGPMGDVHGLPELVQSKFRTIETICCSCVFNLEIIWRLSWGLGDLRGGHEKLQMRLSQ